MNKMAAAALCGALICSTGLETLAVRNMHPLIATHAETPIISSQKDVTIAPAPIAPAPIAPVPTRKEPTLQYGQLVGVEKNAAGIVNGLKLKAYTGTYLMAVTSNTAFLDATHCYRGNTDGLKIGQGIYVFHNEKNEAAAVVYHVPEGTVCPQYHIIEKVIRASPYYKLQTRNGEFFILTDERTNLMSYFGADRLLPADLKEGDAIIAWYEPYAQVIPAQSFAHAVLRLPRAGETDPARFTRGEMVEMMYQYAGTPESHSDMCFIDVPAGGKLQKSVNWALGRGITNGYRNGTFGAGKTITRQQAIAMLWRLAGQPVLPDYTGLGNYTDVKEISHYAQSAMAWAHQQGFITGSADGRLRPNAPAGQELVSAILTGITGHIS